MSDIAESIIEGIRDCRWLLIEYDSTNEKRNTTFWMAIKDIEGKTAKDGVLKGLIHNPSKSENSIDGKIHYSKIVSATPMLWTTYDVPADLILRLENPKNYTWLGIKTKRNRVLSYLDKCNALNNDPYLLEASTFLIEGLDEETVSSKSKLELNSDQCKALINLIYQNDPAYGGSEFSDNGLAMNLLSIDWKNRKYMVAYRYARFDPSEKRLRLEKNIYFNPSFLADGYRCSISHYYDGSTDEFIERFNKERQTLIGELKENLKDRGKGEKINTRPEFAVIQRDFTSPFPVLRDKLEHQAEENNLPLPIRAFLGEDFRRNKTKLNPQIVTYSRPDLKQLLAIYRALSEPVSYVEGPPGTGKTSTIFNLLLSLYFDGQTVLVTANNNKPVDGLAEKLENIKPYTYNKNTGEKVKIPFPYIRLGNVDVNAEAAKQIAQIAESALRGKPKEDMLNEIKTKIIGKNGDLISLLDRYEKKAGIEESEKALRLFLKDAYAYDKKTRNYLDSLHSKYKKLLSETKDVTPEEVDKAVYIAEDDFSCLSYLYYSSINHLSRLKEPKYEKLIEACKIPEDDARGRAFTGWLKDDENMKLLARVFPVIFCTNISSSKLGTGDFLFDMVIMDEAGQADMANSLFPLARGKKCLLVGDPKQLRPIIVMDPSVHDNLKKQWEIDETFDYMTNSLLTHMLRIDKRSKDTMLSYHYRCGKRIIAFSNARYYRGTLDVSKTQIDGEVSLFNCPCDKQGARRNTSLPEARGIVNYIKENDLHKKGLSVSVFTPFVDQAELINALLNAENISNISASTVHSSQGAECDVVLFSSAISQRTSEKTYNWIKANEEIINVGTSRAKQELVIFADQDSIHNLHDKTQKNQKDDDLFALVNYASQSGKVTLIPQKSRYAVYEKSNGSESEDEFHITVKQILSVHGALKLERDVSIGKVFPNDPEALRHSAMFADSVIYRRTGLFGGKWVPLCVFEVAGGEHYKKGKNDILKAKICQQNNTLYYMVANEDVKDYELLKTIIVILSGNNKEREQNMNNLVEQGTLFDYAG